MARSARAAEEPREAVARGGLREGEAAVEPRHVYAEMESESSERLAMFSRRTYRQSVIWEPQDQEIISERIHTNTHITHTTHKYMHTNLHSNTYKHKFMVIMINVCFLFYFAVERWGKLWKPLLHSFLCNFNHMWHGKSEIKFCDGGGYRTSAMMVRESNAGLRGRCTTSLFSKRRTVDSSTLL